MGERKAKNNYFMNTKLFLASVFMLTALCAFAQNNTTDEGVEINGIIWATRNVDVPGTFAENPEDAGMFYQWNRRVGWSASNPMVNSDGGSTWDRTEATGTTWESSNDPCPAGWRVPTQAELQSLSNVTSIWTTINGVNGRLFGFSPNQIFLPAVGTRMWSNGGLLAVNGNFWSNAPSGGFNAHNLAITSSGVAMLTDSRASGRSVRCVLSEDDISTSVTDVSKENNRTPVAFYTITGVRLGQKPQSGIFIILYCDGSAERIMR